MTDNTRLLEDTVKVLNEKDRLIEEKIRLDGGFIGVRLNEDTVQLLETKFREQKKTYVSCGWSLRMEREVRSLPLHKNA